MVSARVIENEGLHGKVLLIYAKELDEAEKAEGESRSQPDCLHSRVAATITSD